MSQPADQASGTDLELEIAELALFAHIGGRLPIVLPALPEQEDETWSQVLDHVVERGLLQRDGDQVAVPDEIEALLLPILASDFAFEATVGQNTCTWLATEATEQELVIECTSDDGQTITLSPVAYDDLESRIAAFLGLDGPARGADGEPTPIPMEQLQAAGEAEAAGKPVELPAAPQFAEAIAAGSLRRIEMRWVDENEVHGSRYEWADLGADGLHVTSQGEDGVVTVQPRASTSFFEHIASLLP